MQTAAALEELATATGSSTADDVLIDAAAFTIAMRDANIDKEFSARLFEFLDEGARCTDPCKSQQRWNCPLHPCHPSGCPLAVSKLCRLCASTFTCPPLGTASTQLQHCEYGTSLCYKDRYQVVPGTYQLG